MSVSADIPSAEKMILGIGGMTGTEYVGKGTDDSAVKTDGKVELNRLAQSTSDNISLSLEIKKPEEKLGLIIGQNFLGITEHAG